MANAQYDTIDRYLSDKPAEVREKLTVVRAAIKRAVPDAQEVISYQIPAFRIGGRVFIYFAGWKSHYSLYPVGEALLEAFGPELTPFKISKGTIRFPLAEPVPEDLIFRIASFKAEETLAQVPKKKPR
jgi:uncharacterized protein YdhG (YjbR/CyaY superfamily)